MNALTQLKASILADGKIDATEVSQVREAIYMDGKIDTEEADFLFELNDACSESENDSSWQDLFIEAISSYLLDDESSPGSIDDKEAAWLLEKLNKDGKVDSVEANLLRALKDKATSVPANLQSFIQNNI